MKLRNWALDDECVRAVGRQLDMVSRAGTAYCGASSQDGHSLHPVSYTHLTLPTNREV